ncbi:MULTISPECIES: DUF4192 domain-containing protein [Nocardioides]|uniref:DUF4192 domain-containing protein n=1 Tax=Nocardioides TaxID=1839 RepID=UPI000A04A0A4|nr:MULTISPECIES: DUF4192 domain-containing protein [Nocardioides]
MTTPDPVSRQMKATCPEDLLAFVPVAIGFAPTSSVVLLSIEGARPFHARIDLPADESDVDDVLEALLRPACRNQVTKVVLVVYDDDTAVADETAWCLHEGFTEAGIEVFELLRVHDGHYFAVLPGRSPEAYRGIPFDVGHHRFAVESVFGGRVTHPSREALAATVACDPVGSGIVAGLVPEAVPLPPAAVRRLIATHAVSGATAPAEEVAVLAVSLALPDVRDEAWRWLRRESARSYVEFWSDVVRRTPEELVAGPAAVLAFTCWLAGEGALAWCAVDRARAVAPAHSLAGLVAEMLTSATSPELWEETARRMGERADGAA